MNEQESEQEQVPDAPVTVKKTSWPKTIGIIAMVFGVLGALNGLMAVGSSFFSEAMAKMAQLPPDFYDKWRPFMLGSGLGTIFVGILLFAGGLFLTLRKRISSLVLNSWAILKMILGVVSSYFTYQMQQEQMPLIMEQQKKVMDKAAGAGGGAGAEQMADMVSSFTEIASLVGMVLGLVWMMVLPVFILIWFIRPKIRKEIAGWGRGS